MNEAMKAAKGRSYEQLVAEYGTGTTWFADGSALILEAGEIMIG